MRIVTIDGERAWPIYKIEVKWGVPIYAPNWIKNNPKHHSVQGLPEGLQWNSTGINLMFRKKLNTLQKDLELTNFVHDIVKRENEYYNRELNWKYLKKSIKLWTYDTWCLGWFSHWTFDVGQTDEEALASFYRYCIRIHKKNIEIYQVTGEEWTRVAGYSSLMGAEDRWRWSGVDINGNKTEPPCRCKYCKERGRITINH